MCVNFSSGRHEHIQENLCMGERMYASLTHCNQIIFTETDNR